MRVLAWTFWGLFVVSTCSTAASLPMVVNDMRPPKPGSNVAAISAGFALFLLALSLYTRFRALPRSLAAGRMQHRSARLLLNLVGCWSLCFFSIAGAIGIARGGGGFEVAVGAVVAATLAVVLEVPYFRAAPPN